MHKYVLPVWVLFFICLISAFVWLVQFAVYRIASDVNSEPVWSGECSVIEVVSKNGDVNLVLACGDDKVETSKVKVVVAWINDRAQPTCEKSALWNRDDHQWFCTIKED